ncbi:MAG TPA: ATPase domain-containing protein [Candidatus Eisenbacteria bacterium]|nr:ATPase domain-containing protein [Candidatus Eisenbacteria bacterium]
MPNERVATGIAGLDALLEGGFLPGRSYLFTGDAGTGKTTACMQFLLAGLHQGETAVYVTVDERPVEILASCKSLEWDLNGYIEEKKLVILDASPYFGARGAAANEKTMDLQRIISDLASYVKRLGASRLAIDPVTPLILAADSHARVQDQARSLMYLLQSHLTTTNVLTSHLPSRGLHDPTSGIEEFLAAGVIVLKVDQVGGSFVRTLSIKKMRGTAVGPSAHPFQILKGGGLVFAGSDGAPAVAPAAPSATLEVFELSKGEK